MKKLLKVLSIFILSLMSICLIFLCLIFLLNNQNILEHYNLNINNDNNLIITLNDNQTLCQLTDTRINDNNWKQAQNKQCVFPLEDKNYKLYLKFHDGKIQEIEEMKDVGKILSTKLKVNQLYLAVNETYKVALEINSVGNINKNYTWFSTNKEVVTFKSNNELIAKSPGSAIIKTKYNNQDYFINVEVTDKIVKAPTTYDTNKEYLPCGFYSESDNDLLDKILKSRISNAGYQTRAGAIEAARFLTLNFPYKINYFYENGRATTFNEKRLAYGEGRYYHEGLFLHNSRFSNILESVNGPAIWGCNLYSNIEKKYAANGLNCSGFIAWVLLNAGFDSGDIGAGITSVPDFTDISKKVKLTGNLINSKTIKAGDLLYGNRVGGHIAMIIGIDDLNYYIAEAYWDEPRGVVINTYNKQKLTKYFSYVILMDHYYEKDGNYTEMWY